MSRLKFRTDHWAQVDGPKSQHTQVDNKCTLPFFFFPPQCTPYVQITQKDSERADEHFTAKCSSELKDSQPQTVDIILSCDASLLSFVKLNVNYASSRDMDLLSQHTTSKIDFRHGRQWQSKTGSVGVTRPCLKSVTHNCTQFKHQWHITVLNSSMFSITNFCVCMVIFHQMDHVHST